MLAYLVAPGASVAACVFCSSRMAGRMVRLARMRPQVCSDGKPVPVIVLRLVACEAMR